ncbi:MAG: T9SS type A sorting domain-containing protein [Bacteroidales bacterium]|nr:T9SS type A sorting domain-containing protein [Bacteroidales bacterium]
MKKNISTLIVLIVSFIFLLSTKLNAQTVNVSDGAFLNIKSNSSLVIPNDLNIGRGTSGIVKMDGDLIKVSGTLNINSGAELQFTDGDLDFANYAYNANSTVTFDGNNQTVMNHNFGNLVFEGTGNMFILGDAGTPTTCNNLTINNTGNTVVVAENKALTVNNVFVNNAGNSGIIISSSSSGDGSLILNTNNINGTVQRFCSNTQWHYVASPINNASTILFNNGYFLAWDATMEWAGLGDYEPWYTYTGSELLNARGYAYFSSGNTISFEGTIHVDDYTQTLRKNSGGLANNQGWNLIGNPYSSAIDWDLAVADGAIPAQAENAIYLFDDDNGSGEQPNYRYYVPSSGGTYGVGTADATKNIPLGQGFFVKTNTDNVSIDIKSSYRIHNSQDFYKTPQTGICRLDITGNDLSDQTIFRLVDDATLGFDSKFDARKLFVADDNFPQIYSLDFDNQSGIAINSIPEDFKQTRIPIGLKASAGNYSFSVSELSIYADNMYFFDEKLNVKLKLTPEFYYDFYFVGGKENNRFFIIFDNSPTVFNDEINNELSIIIYPNPTDKICTISNIKQNSEIRIVDVSGKIMNTINNANNMEIIDLSNYTSGVYYVNIISENENITKKIIKN